MTLLRHRGRILAAILALSPLAYVGSILLENALPARMATAAIGPDQAIQIAAQFAETRQFHTQGWQVGVGGSVDNDLAGVFRRHKQQAIEGFLSPATVHVVFQSANADHWIRVDLTPQGQVIGFVEKKNKQQPEVDYQAAKDAGEAFRRERLSSQSPLVWVPDAPRKNDATNLDRTVAWTAPVPGLPQSTATYSLELYGNRVIGEHRSLALGSAVQQELRSHRNWFSFVRGIGGFYAFLLGVYAVIPYVRRARDKEVSHLRTLVTGVVWVSFAAILTLDPGYLAASLSGVPSMGNDRWQIVIGMFVVGAFIGMAYGAGEGGLRESYSGKLTSLDALLSGKLLSANVARSVLLGGGIAGWLLLLQNSLLLVGHGLRSGADSDILSSSFMKVPLLALLWERSSDAVTVATLGLLLPIVLLRSRVRPRIFYTLLGLCALLAADVTLSDESTWLTFLVSEIALVAALCLPFFAGDLLAAICGVFALRFVGALIQRSAVSASWEHLFLWDVAPAGIAFLLTQVYFAWRGRVYDEDEVRPRYARFLAEHVAMEAEIGAARLAQLRLLPAEPPRIAGLSIAGGCVPAREVGGDFFDFYELGSGRLGVFVAEGGSHELASAMPIALAKGYLLYSATLDLTPAEILRRLNDTLGAALHGNAYMSVLYAVVDAGNRTVRFARTGNSPRLLVNGRQAPEELFSEPASGNAIRHGAFPLSLQDVLLIYTDGLATQIAERRRQWTETFVQKLMVKRPHESAAGLHTAILDAAVRRKQHPPDDVTAVVIRVEQSEAQAMEVVA